MPEWLDSEAVHALERLGGDLSWNGGEPPRLRVRSAAEMLALPEPPDGYELLGPLVVRGGRTIIVGDTGHGKTSVAFQMCHAILTGEEGFGQVGIGEGPALILDLEQGIRSIKRSLTASKLADREDLLYITVPDGLALDQSPGELEALTQVLAEHLPVVVTLDPYYKAHRAEDPNAERPIIDLMRLLDGLRAAYGFALLLPVHPRKPDNTQRGARRLTIHDVAGSGAVTRGAEIVLAVERLGHGAARLRYLKDRDGELAVGEALPLLYTRERGFWVNEESTETDEGAMAKLLAGPQETWMTTREWAREVRVDHNRTKRLLEEMSEKPSEPVYFQQGPPGRHPSARCYAVYQEPPIHLNTPGQQTELLGGVFGGTPYRGGATNTPTSSSAPPSNTPGHNPLLDDSEEEP